MGAVPFGEPGLPGPGERHRVRAADIHEMHANLDRDLLRISGPPHDDWASRYAQWLIDLSDLPGVRPVRSELIYLVVSLDKQFTAEASGEPCYARQIQRHFQPSGS